MCWHICHFQMIPRFTNSEIHCLWNYSAINSFELPVNMVAYDFQKHGL